MLRLEGIRGMNLTTFTRKILPALIISACGSLFAAEDYIDWPHSQKILLNTASGGAEVNSTVAKFPVLVRLNPDNFRYFAQTFPKGADIRFSNITGTQLPYQIERWSDVTDDNDTADIWVMVDTIHGNRLNGHIIMHWGNPNAEDSSNSYAVFDSANGFMGTYHLTDTLTQDTITIIPDASSYRQSGVNSGTGVTTEGLIGLARTFDGTSYLGLGQYPDRPTGTVSCWFRLSFDFDNTSSTTQGIWGLKKDNSNNSSLCLRGTDYKLGQENSTGAFQTKTEFNGSSVYLSGDLKSFDSKRWYYVTFTWGNNAEAIYLNGSLESDTNISQPVGAGNSGWDIVGLSIFDTDNIADASRYFHGVIDEFRIDKIKRSADWIALSYHNQKPSQSLVITSGVLKWDTKTTTGIQAGNGTWGVDAYWTINETQLAAWPGRGFAAQFGGTLDACTVSVAGTQSVDSIAFLASEFILKGDTLDFGSEKGAIGLATGVTAQINAVITGNGGLDISKNTGDTRTILHLNSANNYTGTTTIENNIWCNVKTLTDGEIPGALGAASNDAANLVLNNGVLRYTGSTDAETDRLFTLLPGHSCLYASGNGAMIFTSREDIAYSGSGDRTLEFGGLYEGSDCRFAPVLADGTGGTTSVDKTGSPTSTWVLSGVHTYTGVTNVKGGILIIDGSLDANSEVTVDSGAGIGGQGTIAGDIDMGGSVFPGYNGSGTLHTGSLTLSATSVLEFDLGTQSDTLVVDGDLTLEGTVNITAGTGFSEKTYLLISYSGTLADNSLVKGILPPGSDAEFIITDSTVSIAFTSGLIKQEPSDTTVIIGSEASFSVIADGTDLNYKWIRLSGDSVSDSDTYTIASVSSDDNNEQFRCIVTDGSLVDTSNWATLTVLIKPEITSHSPDTSITVGSSITLAIKVSDTTDCTYLWKKTGDTTSLSFSDSLEISSATTGSSGEYYCLVTNSAGTASDTVNLEVLYPPPVPDFTFSPSDGGIPLEVTFYDSSEGFIDSRIWYFGDGDTSSEKDPTHTYDESGYYRVKLVVNGQGGKDSITHADTITVTGTKTNPLAIEGQTLSERDVRITIKNLLLVDTGRPEPWCDSIGIWITPDQLPDNSTTATLLKRYLRTSFTDSVIIDTLSFPETDSIFGVIAGIYWEDGSISDFQPSSGMIIDFRDTTNRSNPLTLAYGALEDRHIELTVNNIDLVDTVQPIPVCDSIGIWILEKALPTNATKGTRLHTWSRSVFSGTTLVDTFELPAADSVFGLMSALIFSDGSQSVFSPANGIIVDIRDTASVPDTPDSSLSAAVRITDLLYDSTKASLNVAWCIDSLDTEDDLEIGITYSLSEYPEEMNGNQYITVLESCSDSTVDLNEALLFDTLYHVRIFIRRPDGEWITGGEQSRDTVRTGHIYRQVVTYFDTTRTDDTIRIFNNQVILRKDSILNNTMELTDTITVYSTEIPDEFIPAGTAITFSKATKGQEFYIGFRISIPDDESPADVRVYRDSAGLFLTDYASFVDSAAGMVYVVAKDITLPFIPLIDKKSPEVTFLTNTDSTVVAENDIVDSVKIRDNTANIHWYYLYSSGDEPPVVRDSGVLSSNSSVEQLLISKSAHVISSEYGVRAILIVTDGLFSDTFNISRAVYRKDSDPSTTRSLLWQPVYPTAQLSSSNPDSLIVIHVNKSMKYNSRQMRLCRWIQTSSNKNSKDKWVEYSQDSKSVKNLFKVTPGKLLWLKTKKNVTLSLGPAHTLSPKDTFSIKLPPKQFTDFGMPFRFGVAISDILSASGSKAEDIHFFRWTPDKKTNRYKCEYVYAKGLSDYSDKSSVIKFHQESGYSLYNPLKDTVTLKIPPTLPTQSTGKSLVKKQNTKNWSTRLVVNNDNGFAYPPLYCGYAAGAAKSVYPLPPSFEKVSICIYDRDLKTQQAHFLHQNAAEGICKEILFTNNSDTTAKLSYHMESSGTLPEEYTAQLYDAKSNSFSSTGTITVTPHATASSWLVVGDSKFKADFSATISSYHYGLHRIYPNPARSIVNINYTVPADAQERIRLTIFDLSGRKIWDSNVGSLLSPGMHTTVWNGCSRGGLRAGAGVYIVRLSVISQHGSVLKRFDNRITYMP